MNFIEDWKRKKEQAGQRDRELVKKLKRKKGKQLDEAADGVHEQVFKDIDCLECASCCTSIPPIVNKTDAVRISKKLGMKTVEFEKEYLVVDEDGDTVMNVSPCPFLQTDNACLIYEIRPKACRQFPHTDNMDFSKNMKLHVMNATICPGVFHILRRLESVV